MRKLYKKRKLIFGVGINDADYPVYRTVNGKLVTCPFYRKWTHMLRRGYSKMYHERQPTYIGVTICKEWLSFMNFRSWMLVQDWEGLELDKDILYPNNKIYSPKTCVFVSSELNRLLTNRAASRGKYPQGVCRSKQNRKFIAQIGVHGKTTRIGYYDTSHEAHQAYLKAKITHIQSFYPKVSPKIKQGLERHVELLIKETK